MRSDNSNTHIRNENYHEGTASLPRIVIVGAGFGGLNAARHLGDVPARVTVIDRTNHHLFQPLLYQVATAELSPADISAPIRSVLRDQRNTEVELGEVTGVDAHAQEIVLRDLVTDSERRIPYDYLVLATGAGQSYFGHDDWSDYAPSLKTVTDATDIRRKILLAFEEAEEERDPERRRALLTFVIVGGGPTGVELAGAIAELAHRALARDFRHIDPASARVMLVEAMPRILGSFPDRLANAAYKELMRLGVKVRTGQAVEQVDATGVIIGGERVDATNIIWAAGVKASPAAQWLGLQTDRAGHIAVEHDLTVPGHPNIFAIGDTASAKDPRSKEGKPLPGVAPVAIQEGRYVASVLRSRITGEPTPAAFDYFDKGYLATVGRNYAIGYIGKFTFTGLIAWFVWAFVHILYLIGFRNRVIVMLQWTWAYLTFQRGARLITLDEQVNPTVKPGASTEATAAS